MTEQPTEAGPTYPVVQFHGRPAGGPNQSQSTPPLAGLWYVGEAPQWALLQGIECYGAREFTPEFCRNHNRQCWQLSPDGTPCDDGMNCTCWSVQFEGTWTAGDEKRGQETKPAFERLEPGDVPAGLLPVARLPEEPAGPQAGPPGELIEPSDTSTQTAAQTEPPIQPEAEPTAVQESP